MRVHRHACAKLADRLTASLTCVLALCCLTTPQEARAVKLQAAFRGYNARRALQKNQIHVKPQEYLKAVKRHENVS